MYQFAAAQKTSTAKLFAFFQKFLKPVRALRVNDYFSKQCTTIDNNNTVPVNANLSTFDICLSDIVKIIKSLDPNKAHRHNGIKFAPLQLQNR